MHLVVALTLYERSNIVYKPIAFICTLVLVLAVAFAAFCGARTDDPLGIAVSPQTLILNSVQGDRVTVHTDIKLSTVDTSSLALNGVPASGAWADATGCLVAGFDEAAVEAIVEPPSAVLTLTGTLKDGTAFSGSDEVRVTLK